MKPIIEVKGLWKEYRRGAQKEKYLSLRDQVFKSFKPSIKKDTFNALEDINFEVYPGDSLAIIGKNGAGKSTLLKILSKITPPTKGKIILRGRLASLLEVGTGFHPELTGRENVYLNGSILGLGRTEINRQFDAIVNFSGVETFLDTPLKHYSSGMQLRLAFAVAAHLEPEILVIDEVLAVGDSAFQQKCIEKMTEVSSSGRTLLFVSHNMQAVRNLCSKAILIENGKTQIQSTVELVIDYYLKNQNTLKAKFVNLEKINRQNTYEGIAIFKSISIQNTILNFGEEIILELNVFSSQVLIDYVIGITILNLHDETILHISNQWLNKPSHLSIGINKFVFKIQNNLRPGTYQIGIFGNGGNGIQDTLRSVMSFEIANGNPYGYNKTEIIQGKVFNDFSFNHCV